MSIKIISCEVLKGEILSVKPNNDAEYEFVSMGLHLHPEKLKNELQAILDRSKGFSSIVLGFGLCGGAVRNLKASDSELVIPKVHDCIPILLGSKAAYELQRKKEKGTFYLSCGWMISEKAILTEHQRVIEKYGEKKALSVLARMYDSYRRILFIHTGCLPEDEPMRQSKQIAALLKLSYEEIQGRKDFVEKIVHGPWDEESFVHIPPFATVEEELFEICS